MHRVISDSHEARRGGKCRSVACSYDTLVRHSTYLREDLLHSLGRRCHVTRLAKGGYVARPDVVDRVGTTKRIVQLTRSRGDCILLLRSINLQYLQPCNPTAGPGCSAMPSSPASPAGPCTHQKHYRPSGCRCAHWLPGRPTHPQYEGPARRPGPHSNIPAILGV